MLFIGATFFQNPCEPIWIDHYFSDFKREGSNQPLKGAGGTILFPPPCNSEGNTRAFDPGACSPAFPLFKPRSIRALPPTEVKKVARALENPPHY